MVYVYVVINGSLGTALESPVAPPENTKSLQSAGVDAAPLFPIHQFAKHNTVFSGEGRVLPCFQTPGSDGTLVV